MCGGGGGGAQVRARGGVYFEPQRLAQRRRADSALTARGAWQPKTKESLEKLRNSVALMEKREAFLQKKADDELKQAKAKLAAKNKKAALAHLKRKKNYEAQIEKIQGSRLTLETQMVRRRAARSGGRAGGAPLTQCGGR